MSSDTPNKEKSMNNTKKDKDDVPKKSKTDPSETKLPAGTSKSETGRNKSKNQDEKEKWGFFPQNMWYWKQEEPQQEVQLKNWSSTSQNSMGKKNEPTQQPATKVAPTYIWPDTVNVQDPQRLVNQPTLSQLIEQKTLRQNQLVFTSEFNKHVDYLGERISKTKLNILIAQLNEILPSSSEEIVDSTKKLTRAKPLKASEPQELERKPSKVSENLTPEEIAQRDQLRQNQLNEYENLRDQIDLFEQRSSSRQIDISSTTSKETTQQVMDESISKADLNKIIDLLNEEPSAPKEKLTVTLKELIKSKPQILEVVEQALQNKSESIANHKRLREAQLEEIEKVREQIALYEDRSVPANFSKADTIMKKLSSSVFNETVSRTGLNKILSRLDKSETYPKPAPLKIFSRKKTTSKRLTPEEIARREELRQNQIQEYETLREQIGLYGDRSSETKEVIFENAIKTKELNLFFKEIKNVPDFFRK